MNEKNQQLIKTPMYQQLNNILREMITSKQFLPGDQFLTEREVSSKFDVSRATANKAISTLVAEGLLIYKKGVGTFVSRQTLDYDLGTLISFTEKAKMMGMEPSTSVLVFDLVDTVELPKEIIGKMDIGEEEKLYYIERLRFADGVPVILEKRYIRERYCRNLEKEDLEGSLYYVFQNKYNLEITGAWQNIRAVSVGPDDAAKLDMEISNACFLVKSTGLIGDEVPLWYENTLYRGELYEFRGSIGAIPSAAQMRGSLIQKEQRKMEP